MSSPKEVTIYCTVKEDEVHTIALSREHAWKSLTDYWGYSDDDHERWRVVGIVRTVPVTSGTVVDPECDHHHVMWTCPFCEDEHYVDVGAGETGPSIWYCDNALDMDRVVLVEW